MNTDKQRFLILTPLETKVAIVSDRNVAVGFHYDMAMGRRMRLAFALSPQEARKLAALILKNADMALGLSEKVN